MNLHDITEFYKVPDIWWTSHLTPGIIKAEGKDTLDLLHRLSTNACLNLQHGIGKQTILATDKGRIIDVITVIPQLNHFIILTSHGNESLVISWLKKYIIMEDIHFTDISTTVDIISIHGSASLDFITQFMQTDALSLPMHGIIQSQQSNTRVAIRTMPLHELHFYILDNRDNNLLQWFKNQADIQEYDQAHTERERILSGMGVFPCELSEQYNPLEAGLLHLIDFKKGCYIGQEVIARLDSYNKVNKRLIGIVSEMKMYNGDSITINGESVGIITSTFHDEQCSIALGYLRSEHVYNEIPVTIVHGELNMEATVYTLPLRK